MAKTAPRDPRCYRIGIDVGTHSVGLAAIEYDALGRPTEILVAISHLHDSGVLEPKTNTTRLAASGMARRTRRLVRRRRRRLQYLEDKFKEWGWSEPSRSSDPYSPWRARARLSANEIVDERELGQTLVCALRHLARHRGWRNPYHSANAFYRAGAPSEQFVAYRARVEEAVGRTFADDVTVAELAIAAIDHNNRRALRMGKTAKRRDDRTSDSYLGGKLMQQDNANEIHAWARTQGLSNERLREIIDVTFQAESPRGSWIKRIGKDPLNGELRAPKATDTFQRFTILTTLANVRAKDGNGVRPLTLVERTRAYEHLVNLKPRDQPTWSDIAKVVDLARGALTGTAVLHDGQERLPQRPPTMVTNARMREVKKPLSPLRVWWDAADRDARDALILLLADGFEDDKSPAGSSAREVIFGLDEEALGSLDSLDLPAGRAAYSLGTMRQIIDFLLGHDGDLYVARRALFDVPEDWTPPAEPINAPVGNPAVDRVLKIVGRFTEAAEAEWGVPAQVTLEHVREAFVSAATVDSRDKEMQRRMEANELQRQRIKAGENDGGRTTMADVRRYDAITRQKGQCLYCGDTITFKNSELDHIVPRKGVGSTNTRSNLAAVCISCNRSKGNVPFGVWATRSRRPEVTVEEAVARLRFWTKDKGLSPRTWSPFVADVKERLERTEADPEIDGRSMESVAWMANELRGRVAAHFGSGTEVSVYQGAVTAGARQAAGIADKIPFIGGGGKTRLDRRHHAVDAAVVTLLDASVARTLAERNSLRSSRDYEPREKQDDWKTYSGNSAAAKARFVEWRASMGKLAELLGEAFADDRVVVMENLRLRLGDGRVHEDTVRPLVRRLVSAACTRDEIDAASTPALWHALTRDRGFDPVEGLPENPERRLRLHGSHLAPDDEISFFGDASKEEIQRKAALLVREGWAQLGDSIHHARIYRWTDKGKPKWGMLRVFAADLYKHRREDLFAVEPDQSWISMRNAHPSIGRADLSQLEYVGWLVPGDELLIDPAALDRDAIGTFMSTFEEPIRRWIVSGFETATIVNLRPLQLAGEGLDRFAELSGASEGQVAVARSILTTKSWRPSVNALFSSTRPSVVRRDALGRPRLVSNAHLPVSWSAG
ncbi:type II CRISPR RNA-guided endonuclease Cas9 [Nocardioides hungaricus]